ncbi:hypothetical protein G6021_15955 [Dietzia sp. CW19]|uniref:Polysaccharide biosynthesis protein C-terminal domain-containing protein n=1 Tax=Dietzia maris TaxID=37915 RepID=A0AAE4QUZ4_9ACTN|nr:MULTISPECIES: hypothetical protein [Dietzia]MBB1052548.1 hypothetical protein [Dietzia sp. CW19]MDV6298600.1 hypothetical protein [Dietzia maris]
MGTVQVATFLRLVAMALSFAGGVVVARELGDEGRGYQQVIVSVGLFGSAIVGCSAELGASRFWARYPEERPALPASMIAGILLLGVPAGGAVILFLYLSHGSLVPISSLPGASFAGGLLLLYLANTWLQRFLLLDGSPVLASVLSAVESAIVAGGVAVLVVADLLTPYWALVVISSSLLFSTSVSVLILLSRYPNRVSFPPFRSSLFVGLRFHSGQVALAVLARADLVLLSAISGLAAAGVYSVAVSITAPILVVGTSLTSVYLNRQFSDDRPAAFTARLVGLSIVIMVPLAVVVALGGSVLIPAVWGSQFAPAVGVLPILMIGLCATGVQRPIGQYLVRHGLAAAANIRAFVASVICVVLILVLGPRFGAMGVAVASSTAWFVYATISFCHFVAHSSLGLQVIGRNVLQGIKLKVG